MEALARKHGIEAEFRNENGSKLKLSGEFLGEPVYNSSLNILGGASISADEVWPLTAWPYSTQNLGLGTAGITGAGQTLGLFENDGGVRRTHVEMGTTRIFQKDSAALDSSGHATNVAGTMAGSGATTLFGLKVGRGVAYEAKVFAYESDVSFATNRLSMAAGDGTDPAVRASNHSWGKTSGWRVDDIDPGAGVNYQWVWYGPQSSAFQEDFKFGFYFPNTDFADGSTEIDKFQQTDAPQHLMVFAAGNDRGSGPGAAPTTYYYRTGNTTWTQASPAHARVWTTGDAGGYDTVIPPGTTKNVLTVGACEDVYHIIGSSLYFGYGPGAAVTLAPFSGFGPTDDGRIKPELVAVGYPNVPLRNFMGMVENGFILGLITPGAANDSDFSKETRGTSFAAPAVSGMLALVMQRRAQLYPSLPAAQAWRGSTLKAIAINTCDDYGAEGPDYGGGFGLANARKAVLAVNEDQANGRGSLIKEISLAVGQSESWVVRSSGSVPLAVTVPWSDPEGPALTTISGADPQNAMLVNNINVKVEYLGADTFNYPPPATPVTTYHPWVLNPDLTSKTSAARSAAATRGTDSRNNVEKVSVAAPAAGRYRVTVTHAGGLSGNPAPSAQVVSVALSGVTPELPRITNVVKSPTANQHLISFTADPGAYFTIQSSTDLVTWTDVGSVLAEAAANALIATNTNSEERRFWRLRRGQ